MGPIPPGWSCRLVARSKCERVGIEVKSERVSQASERYQRVAPTIELQDARRTLVTTLPTGSNPQGRKLNFCYLHFLIFLQHSMSEKLNIPGSVSEIFN